MATVYELFTSRKYLNNEGKPRAERQFVVVDAADESVVVGLFGNDLPGEYEHYPNDSGLPYDMLAFDYSITKDPSAVNMASHDALSSRDRRSAGVQQSDITAARAQ